MAKITCLHAKSEVEAFCRRNPFLHLYSIGDLDDFFWPHTVWYAWRDGDQVQQLALCYTDCAMPTLLALAEPPVESMRQFLTALLPFLPRRFYAHLTESVADALASDYRLQSHGTHFKMGLTDPTRALAVDGSLAEPLTVADERELLAFYPASYPGNWFVPRMLETGCYFGIRRAGELACVTGVHVYSPTYQVATLGNITTHPDFRGQGLATAATARLCQHLLNAGIRTVGLNVKADNPSAIACYQKLGFSHIADYGEFTLEAK